jgi:hypothetical protein
VAYVDNSSNFKIYYNGNSSIEADNKPEKFTNTDDLVAYEFEKRLSVFDRGQTTVLTYAHGGYTVGDSVIGFYDTYNSVFKVYKDGVIHDVENLFEKAPPKSFKAGDNLVAFVNYNGFLKVYYAGQSFDLESVPPLHYKVGNNTVAYIDGASSNFKVFYKGATYVLETFPPTSFKVGDDLIAYVDNTGNFKIFYLGEVYTVQSYEPQYFDAVDNVAVYGDAQNFFGFYHGKTTKLETFKPDAYQLDFNSVAYKDRSNKLKFFSEGVLKEGSSQIVNTFQLTRNVLMYSTDLESMHFLCNGKTY